jgi:transposase-like protein
MKMITADLVVDETKRDTKGRRITPKARRQELLAAYEQSGLTQAAFARREGVKYQTFATWVSEWRRRAAAVGLSKSVVPVRFAEVNLPPAKPSELSASADALSVTLPDGVVVRGAEAAAVAALVKALRA